MIIILIHICIYGYIYIHIDYSHKFHLVMIYAAWQISHFLGCERMSMWILCMPKEEEWQISVSRLMSGRNRIWIRHMNNSNLVKKGWNRKERCFEIQDCINTGVWIEFWRLAPSVRHCGNLWKHWMQSVYTSSATSDQYIVYENVYFIAWIRGRKRSKFLSFCTNKQNIIDNMTNSI